MNRMHKQYRALWGKEAEMLLMQRRIIDSKPALRAMYDNFYSEIKDFVPENGTNIEVGTGHGYTSSHFKNVIHTDMTLTPLISVCNDAQKLPFKDGTLDTIMVFGTFHHFKEVETFFGEARRALKQKGRIIMIEPYCSALSYPILKYFGSEDVNMKTIRISSDKYNLIDANVAIPTIFFRKKRAQFSDCYKGLDIIYESYHTPFLFFASGGYIGPNLCPRPLLPALLWIEKKLRPVGKWIGSMMTIVLEKQ